MSLVVYPLRKRAVGGTLTLLHLSDDNLRLLFDLVDMPLALKLACRALRSLAPAKTKTKVAHVVRGIELIVWAHQCGLFEHVSTATVAEIATMTWPGGDEALEYMKTPSLYQHNLALTTDCEDLCVAAARAGLIPMLEYLDYEQHYSDTKTTRPLQQAAYFGHLECVKWMFARDNERTILASSGDVLDCAAEGGQLGVARWLVDHIAYRGGTACAFAARGGNVALLDMLIKAGFPWSRDLYLQAMRMFDPRTEGLSLETIQYVLTNGLEWDRNKTWEKAVSEAQTETVVWLVDNDPEGVHFQGDSQAALYYAAERGGTAILRLASEHGIELAYVACDRAARGNHMETLEWLHSKGVVGSDGAPRYAVGQGHIAILEHLRSHGGYAFHSELYEKAADSDQHAALEWLESIGAPLPLDWDTRQKMLNCSLENANQEMAEWMLERGCGELKRQHIFEAADNYQLELFDWLRERDCPYDLEALIRLCESDNLNSHDPIGATVAKLCVDAGQSPPFATSGTNLSS